jgi:hypothetical protein
MELPTYNASMTLERVHVLDQQSCDYCSDLYTSPAFRHEHQRQDLGYMAAGDSTPTLVEPGSAPTALIRLCCSSPYE